MSNVHIAYVGLVRVNRLGQVLSKVDGNSTIAQHLDFTTEHRIIPDSNIPNTSNYPTVQQYLALEAASGYFMSHMDQTSVVTATAAGGGGSGNNSSVATVPLSLDTNAYASGDVLAATQEITSAVRVDGGTAIIQSLVINDKDDQKGALEVIFFSSNVSIGTENAAVSISDSDADKVLGVVTVTADNYVDLGGCSVASFSNLGFLAKADSGTSLFVALVSRDTKTYSAAGLSLRVGFLQD